MYATLPSSFRPLRGTWSLVLRVVCFAMLAVSGLAFAAAHVAPPAPPPPPPLPGELINAQTVWRFYFTYRTPLGATADRLRFHWSVWGEDLSTPLPPTDWRGPDFDDSGWPRRACPFLGSNSQKRPVSPALICVRGRFGITYLPSVRDLKLTLVYRGGLAVYVNGRELGRGHLPQGDATPFAVAESYPPETYMGPDNQPLPALQPKEAPPAQLARRYAARDRTVTFSIPNDMLLKGPNVIAIGIHPSPPLVNLPAGSENWDTVGLLSVQLRGPSTPAAQANVGAPAGIRVWNADPHLRPGVDVSHGDPFEPLRPLTLLAPRNGVASAQVVVSAPAPLMGLAVQASDLKSLMGHTIPANAVQVRYGKASDQWVGLYDKPPEPAAIQPVWVTVQVPEDTPPDKYEGKLDIRGAGTPVAASIELTVCGWRMPSPRERRTFANLLQSPEAVAGMYRVPLWSDVHFKLLEKSFALMAQAGNQVLGISPLAKSVFGDDPQIVFRREGSSFVPEFKFLERYLTLYNQYAGEPRFLSVQVWSYGFYQRGEGRDGGKMETWGKSIPIKELRGNELLPAELPMYGAPATEAVWQQVMDGVRALTQKIGWRNVKILVGTGGDTWPHQSTVELFRKVAPYARWRVLTHGNGAPKWGPTPEQRVQPNGMMVGYLEMAREMTNERPSTRDCPVTANSRDTVSPNPFSWMQLIVLNTTTRKFDGFCWKGLDYWTYTTPAGTQRGPLNIDVHFGNMVGNTPRTLAAPGPQGAVATVQFEAMREAIQCAEALFFIGDVLGDSPTRRRLNPDLLKRCQEISEDLPCILETGYRFGPQGATDVRRQVARLYEITADLGKALGRSGP